jgi:hypothetical protein
LLRQWLVSVWCCWFRHSRPLQAPSLGVPAPRARGERVPSDHEDGSNRTVASTDPVCNLWDRMRKTESRPHLKFFPAIRTVDWVNRNPIDSLHGENSEQRTECEPESRGAARRGPKQERNGDKRGKFTDAGNREAGVVNLLYGHIRLIRKPHFAGQLMQHLKQRFFPT